MDIDEIRQRFDLRHLIPSDRAARDMGQYRVQRCLWHADDDPSLLVYPDGYHCRACGAWGDAVDWIKFSRQLPFREALRWFDDHIDDAKPPPPPPPAPESLPGSLADAYHVGLTERALRYYRGRGLSDDAILRFRLGYGPPPGQERCWFSIPVFSEGRLVNIKFRRDDTCPDCAESAQEHDGSLVCPSCGQIWQPAGPKYLGLQGHGAPALFNDTALGSETLLLVEGEFDAIAATQHGFPAVSSTGGARSFPKEWAARFRPHQRLYACYDNDTAGREGLEHLRSLFPRLRELVLPVGNKGDISDYLKAHTADDLRGLLEDTELNYCRQRQVQFLRRRETRRSRFAGKG